MSIEYDLYLKEHKENVEKAFRWFQEKMSLDISKIQETHPDVDLEHQICFAHDASKNEPDEYGPYDLYFYGGNRSYDVCRKFDVAWLKHIHRNPHHWQHWILYYDDPNLGFFAALDMPINYILEMICDWWSFSWKTGNLYEIFKWYEERKDYINLSPGTRAIVDGILQQMLIILDLEKECTDVSVDISENSDTLESLGQEGKDDGR